MPRSGRGGSRQGSQGSAYANRSDMNQPVRTPPSNEYGQSVRLREAQQAIPLPAGGGSMPQGAPPAQPGPMPGELAPINAPSANGDPVTSGLPIGAGPGPEALASGQSGPFDLTVEELRAIYQRYPNPDLARLIAVAEYPI